MYQWSKTQRITLMGMFTAVIFLLTFTPLGFPQIPLIGSATVIHIPVIIGAILLGPKYGAVLGFMFGLASMLFATFQSTALNAFAFTPLRPVPGTDNGSPWALLIAFIPRILVGMVAPLVYMGLVKILPRISESIKLATAAIVASMTNTLLVLHLLYFIFREPWSLARENANAPAHEAALNSAAEAWANAAAAARDAIYNNTQAMWDYAMSYARYAVEYEQAAERTSRTALQITYAFIAGVITGFGVPEAVVAAIIVPAVCIALFAVANRMVSRKGVS